MTGSTLDNFARPRRARRRGGFSLLELLVVGMVGVIVLTFIANASRWYDRESNALHVAGQLGKELRLAGEAIAQDFGPALAARTVDGTQLQLNFDTDGDGVAAWAAPDTVVEYARVGDRLVRRDLTTNAEVPMANRISDLVAELSGGHLNVSLTASYRLIDQQLTFQLRDP